MHPPHPVIEAVSRPAPPSVPPNPMRSPFFHHAVRTIGIGLLLAAPLTPGLGATYEEQERNDLDAASGSLLNTMQDTLPFGTVIRSQYGEAASEPATQVGGFLETRASGSDETRWLEECRTAFGDSPFCDMDTL
ncbi:MAG: hypothetical protein PHW10_06380, partial [Candidatus Peribacteraceae bacterium]|nr:hypothetical protein [Candidatus Peribacteraceae bacterium]